MGRRLDVFVDIGSPGQGRARAVLRLVLETSASAPCPSCSAIWHPRAWFFPHDALRESEIDVANLWRGLPQVELSRIHVVGHGCSKVGWFNEPLNAHSVPVRPCAHAACQTV
jgi:hypothetical protein